MQLEQDPDSRRRVLVTPESGNEVRLLMDAMIIRAHFAYYKPFIELQKSQFSGEDLPTLKFTKRQLRWIGKRLAPWDKHIINVGEREDIELAHEMAVTISEHLNQPRLAEGG